MLRWWVLYIYIYQQLPGQFYEVVKQLEPYQWFVERARMEERMAREARAGVRMLSHWLLEPRGAVG